MKHPFVVVAVSVACAVSAQRVLAAPYVVARAGVRVGLAADVTGGQRSAVEQPPRDFDKPFYRPVELSVFPAENGELLSLCAKEIGTDVNPGPDWAISGSGRSRTLSDTVVTGITFPAMDQGSRTSGPLKVELSPSEAKEPVVASTIDGRRQKLWLTSNFRVKISGIPLRVMHIEPVRVSTEVGDLDGDGFEEFYARIGEVAFDVPRADAAPYLEWFQSAEDGNPVYLPMSIEYYDGTSHVMTVQVEQIGIVALGPRSPLDGPGSTLRLFGKAHELKGHVTLIK